MFYAVSASRRKQVDRTERLHGLLRLGRNIAISLVLLAAVLVCGGFTYALFSGRPIPKLTSPDVAVAPPVLLKPTAPNPRNPVGVAIEGMTTPATTGSSVSLAVKTTPGAECEIKIAYPSTFRDPKAPIPQVANDYGVATWSWEVAPATPHGVWPITITCAYLGHSAIVVGDLQVTN